MRRSDITFEKILSDYQLALDLAKQQEKPSEIVSAASAQAKLVGLIVDRRELGQAGDFDGLNDIEAIISKVREDVGNEAADAMARAFSEPQINQAAEQFKSLEPPTDTVQ